MSCTPQSEVHGRRVTNQENTYLSVQHKPAHGSADDRVSPESVEIFACVDEEDEGAFSVSREPCEV